MHQKQNYISKLHCKPINDIINYSNFNCYKEYNYRLYHFSGIFQIFQARRVNERIVDHTGRDINSHLLKHSIESAHKSLEAVDYKIIGTGYRNNTMKRKLSEALFIKELKPTLNKQEKSLPLKLFN